MIIWQPDADISLPDIASRFISSYCFLIGAELARETEFIGAITRVSRDALGSLPSIRKIPTMLRLLLLKIIFPFTRHADVRLIVIRPIFFRFNLHT